MKDGLRGSETPSSGWIIGKPEVILGPNSFTGQVVNAFILRRTIGN